MTRGSHWSPSNLFDAKVKTRKLEQDCGRCGWYGQDHLVLISQEEGQLACWDTTRDRKKIFFKASSMHVDMVNTTFWSLSEKRKNYSEWKLCGQKCLVGVRGVPLVSDANRKVRLQFALVHKNWAKKVENSRFQLQHSDGRIRIWQHESMDPSCPVSTFRLVKWCGGYFPGKLRAT